MDRLIKRFDSAADGDLRVCEARGIAYQADMAAARVSYDDRYLAKVHAYDGSEIAAAVNAGRVALLDRHLARGARVLDYGCGDGAFMRAASRAGFEAFGFDLIPATAAKLEQDGLLRKDPHGFEAVTMWDAIEHFDVPEVVLKRLGRGSRLFVSLPIFGRLADIRASKHYRPGEHLYYFTAAGFVAWMALYGYRLLESSDHEVAAGRESIGAFAFCRDLPDYHDHLAAYAQIHSTRYYGDSATELHLADAAKVVRELGATSILDFGCGRSDLAAHFWLDGARRIARYDPAIPALSTMPEGGKFDLVFCCDVMEHVPMADVDRVLEEIRSMGNRAFFTISTKLARAKLPDGRNAHVTLLNHGEWLRWLRGYFGGVRAIPSRWEHELIAVAGKGI